MRLKVHHSLGPGTICLLVSLSTSLLVSWNAQAGDKEKLTAEEVVARHLKSIGTPEDLASVKTRVAAGTSVFNLRSPGSGQNSGLSILFSQGNQSVIAMNFKNADYPHEKFGYDGEKLIISYIRPGIRSTLGDFVFQRSAIFKDGLMGGTLSTAWPLLNFDKTIAKLEYAGKKKVDGREVHVLRYSPRKGSDVKISMFFDAETFQHVRTEYDQTVSAQMGRTPDAAKDQQRDLHYELVEQFSDFKQVGKLVLPHTYKIKLMMERSPAGTYLADWEMNFSKFSFNQPLEAKWFDVNVTSN
ncbi:MAG: hypothetical protein M3R67_01550 [Acidobacteriota bacterium]|nr:hypothetical protein [Acidobacteriota bacterium]